MKKAIRWALALGLCLALLVCGALADEATGIHVQLDGQDLTFTDAVPQMKDWRTFLPFRAVFEAMGAEVGYDNGVVTAVRGGKTLTMTLGQTAATVTEDGKTTPITMDVAPYLDPDTQRTYVPVRFAAQAFGCAVGWDQAAQTAIIIDLDKLMDTSLEGKSFTYLEKLAALNAKYETGIWNMDATFDAGMTMMGSPAMTMNGTVIGVTEGEDKAQADMNMKFDMSKYMGYLAQMSGQEVPAEAQAMMDALKNDGVTASVRGDMVSGKLYMTLDMGALSTETGLDPDTWYQMDMGKFMELSGLDMDWTALMAQAKSIDYLDLVKAVLTAAEPDDAANDYAQLKSAVDALSTTLSDQGFVERDGQYVSDFTLRDGDFSINIKLTLELDGEALTSYTLSMGTETSKGNKMSIDVSMNDKDEMHMKMGVGADGVMPISLDMTMDCKYTPGATAPLTAPPEGATVVDYFEMLQAMMGEGDSLGVIGGADGPTSIVTG